MKSNYFFEYLIKNPQVSREAKANAVNFLQDIVRNGKMLDIVDTRSFKLKPSIYKLLRKDSTNCKSLTNEDLSLFAKDLYTTMYPQLVAKYSPEIEFETPETVTPELCFKLAFVRYQNLPFLLGTHTQNCSIYPYEEGDLKKDASHDFIHFCPNGWPNKTNSEVDSREITKRLYFNVSPANSLNIIREMAEYMQMSPETRFFCKFHTDKVRSDTLVLYTNEEQLPEVVHFLNQLQEHHPEYLEPADCKMPFYAPFTSYCGIADEPKYVRSSFNSEFCKAITPRFHKLYSDIMSELDYKNAIYSVGKKGYNAENFSKYTAWQKTCDKIHEMKTKYANAKTNADLQSKAYYDELWEQFLKAKTNPESQMAKDIDALGNALYKSIQSGEPLRQNIVLPTYTKRENSHDDLKNIKKISTIEGAKYCDQLDLNFNFHREIFNTLGGEKLLQEKLNAENFSQIFGADLEEHHLSPDYIFMNTETASKYDEYHRDYIRGNIDYSTSPAPQQNQQAQQH